MTRMQKFTLELLYHIIGIGSASGLLLNGQTLYLLSDNAAVLYRFDTKSQELTRISLLDFAQPENIPKKLKPDFEAIAKREETLYLFGSGSTPKRNLNICVNTKNSNEIAQSDLSQLYAKMQSVSKITADDFNLEGAAYGDKKWYFLQRGNEGSQRNGLFTIHGNLNESSEISWREISLPKTHSAYSSFTDCVYIDGRLWFLCTAEATQSTYLDGEVAGSSIGALDPESGKIIFFETISDSYKFEGLTVFEKNDSQISFLLCADNDSDVLESEIFKLTVSIPTEMK